MAHFEKATSVKDWLNQRLAIEKVEKVMASEYWIPKKHQLPLGDGHGAFYHIRTTIGFWDLSVDVLSAKCRDGF
jgi:hypothetical protein